MSLLHKGLLSLIAFIIFAMIGYKGQESFRATVPDSKSCGPIAYVVSVQFCAVFPSGDLACESTLSDGSWLGSKFDINLGDAFKKCHVEYNQGQTKTEDFYERVK